MILAMKRSAIEYDKIDRICKKCLSNIRSNEMIPIA